jgi:hypothetical protein
MSETRYFHALNAAHPIQGKGFQFKFECYILCGTWMGVFSASDPIKITSLSELCKTNLAVTEINKEEYENCLKKNSGTLSDWNDSLNLPGQSQTSVLVSPAGALVEPNPSPATDSGKAPINDLDDALVIGRVMDIKTPTITQ